MHGALRCVPDARPIGDDGELVGPRAHPRHASRRPCDLKALDDAQLDALAAEIRDELIEHRLADRRPPRANLGVVELTLGIHRALDCPDGQDRLGRRAPVATCTSCSPVAASASTTLRQYGGVCGFPKRSESPVRRFDTGHASRLALRRARAGARARRARRRRDDRRRHRRRLDDRRHGVRGAEPHRAPRHAARRRAQRQRDVDLAERRRARELPRARAARPALHAAARRRRVARSRTTALGAAMVDAGEAVKESVKQLLVPGMLFEELGLKYVGPDRRARRRAGAERGRRWRRQADGPGHHPRGHPKGAATSHAEDQPDAFHGIGAVLGRDRQGERRTAAPSATPRCSARRSSREAATDERIVRDHRRHALRHRPRPLRRAFPDRFYDVGIAEQHAVGLAAGLALRRACCRSSRSTRRSCSAPTTSSSWTSRCRTCTWSSASTAPGSSARTGRRTTACSTSPTCASIPNLMVLAPADEAELARHAAHRAARRRARRDPLPARRGTRRTRCPPSPVVLRGGRARRSAARARDVALLAVGPHGRRRRAGRRRCSPTTGVSASVVNMRWVKPLDLETVSWAAASHRLVVTIEENTGVGRLRARRCCEALADLGARRRRCCAWRSRTASSRTARRTRCSPTSGSRPRACATRSSAGSIDVAATRRRSERRDDATPEPTSRSLSAGSSPRASRREAAILAGEVRVDGERRRQGRHAARRRRAIEVAEAPAVRLARRREARGRARARSASTSPGCACVDVGASTGGFTDCLLQRGARVGDGGRRRLRAARVVAAQRPARARVRAHQHPRRRSGRRSARRSTSRSSTCRSSGCAKVLPHLARAARPTTASWSLWLSLSSKLGKGRVGKKGVVRDAGRARRGARSAVVRRRARERAGSCAA